MIRRCISNLAHAVSVLLCITVICVWIKSYTHPAGYVAGPAGGEKMATVQFGQGRVEFAFIRAVKAGFDPQHWWHMQIGDVRMEPAYFLGFGAGRAEFYWVDGESSPPAEVRHFLSIPFWFFVILLLTPTTWSVTARKLRDRSGCGKCGYNLTGNTSGVCPECGTAPPAKPESVA